PPLVPALSRAGKLLPAPTDPQRAETRPGAPREPGRPPGVPFPWEFLCWGHPPQIARRPGERRKSWGSGGKRLYAALYDVETGILAGQGAAQGGETGRMFHVEHIG